MASPPAIRPDFRNKINRHSRDDLTTVAEQLITLIEQKQQPEELTVQATSLRAFVESSDMQPAPVFQAALPFIKTLRREEVPESSILAFGIWNQLFAEANYEDRTYHAVTHPGGNRRSFHYGRLHSAPQRSHAPRRVKVDSEDTADCLTVLMGLVVWALRGFRS